MRRRRGNFHKSNRRSSRKTRRLSSYGNSRGGIRMS